MERNRIDVLMGPLATAEVLASNEYIKSKELPTLAWSAAADDVTQRQSNPWFVRVMSTSSQCAHPMAHYCAETLKYRRMAVLADDLAFGHEMCGGFQRVFEQLGGKVVQRLFSPLNVADYGNYLAQLKTNVDGIFIGYAGTNGFRFLSQLNDFGLKGKINVVGGHAALDEPLLRNMGDESLGVITASWYSAEIDNPQNKRFVEGFNKQAGYDPGAYGAGTYVSAQVVHSALNSIGGKIEDRQSFMKALRAAKVDTIRGPISFDNYGNVVGTVYIRRVERMNGKLVNKIIHTYANVSQFWNYPAEEFLKSPVYSREFPTSANLEN